MSAHFVDYVVSGPEDEYARRERDRDLAAIDMIAPSVAAAHPVHLPPNVAASLRRQLIAHLRTVDSRTPPSETEIHDLWSRATDDVTVMHGVGAVGVEPGREAPYSIFDAPRWRMSSANQVAEVATALDLIEGVGGNQFLVSQAPLLVFVRVINGDDAARSWTNPLLAGSVYTDYISGFPLLAARDLIHEATHSWLNKILAVTGTSLDRRSKDYWSPWRDEMRPLFGFTHAVASFTAVVGFLRLIAETQTGRTAEMAEILMQGELPRLRGVAATLEKAPLPPTIRPEILRSYSAATA